MGPSCDTDARAETIHIAVEQDSTESTVQYKRSTGQLVVHLPIHTKPAGRSHPTAQIQE